MSDALGSALAPASTEPDWLKSDGSDPKKVLPDSGAEALSDDPWVKALFGVSQAVTARSQLVQGQIDSIAKTQADFDRGAVAELGPAQPTAARYSLADLAPQLADPLAPLRDRDRQALTEIFAHQPMGAIEADILTRLSHLVPEPPWDIEPYEFLREFL